MSKLRKSLRLNASGFHFNDADYLQKLSASDRAIYDQLVEAIYGRGFSLVDYTNSRARRRDVFSYAGVFEMNKRELNRIVATSLQKLSGFELGIDLSRDSAVVKKLIKAFALKHSISTTTLNNLFTEAAVTVSERSSPLSPRCSLANDSGEELFSSDDRVEDALVFAIDVRRHKARKAS